MRILHFGGRLSSNWNDENVEKMHQVMYRDRLHMISDVLNLLKREYPATNKWDHQNWFLQHNVPAQKDVPILQFFTTNMAMDPIPLRPQPCPLTFLPVYREKIQFKGGKSEDIIEIQAK